MTSLQKKPPGAGERLRDGVASIDPDFGDTLPFIALPTTFSTSLTAVVVFGGRPRFLGSVTDFSWVVALAGRPRRLGVAFSIPRLSPMTVSMARAISDPRAKKLQNVLY
jgi:hypothetical protein